MTSSVAHLRLVIKRLRPDRDFTIFYSIRNIYFIEQNALSSALKSQCAKKTGTSNKFQVEYLI